jgi:hypothetical protein
VDQEPLYLREALVAHLRADPRALAPA